MQPNLISRHPSLGTKHGYLLMEVTKANPIGGGVCIVFLLSFVSVEKSYRAYELLLCH